MTNEELHKKIVEGLKKADAVPVHPVPLNGSIPPTDTPPYQSIRIHTEAYDKLSIWAKRGDRSIVKQVDRVVEAYDEKNPTKEDQDGV